MRRLLGSALALALAGCAGAAPPPVIELGTGVTGFEPLAAGGMPPIYEGSQGGYHIYVHMRGRHLEGGAVELAVSASGGDGSLRCRGFYPEVELVDVGGGWSELAEPIRCYVPEPVGMPGQTLRLELSAVDGDGRAASDLRMIVAGEIVPR